MKTKLLTICLLLATLISEVNAEAAYNLVCKDDNDFTTIFKIDKIRNEIIHIGSIISENDSAVNKGKKYKFYIKQSILKWNNKFAISYGYGSDQDIYLRFFDFVNKTVTISFLDPSPSIKKSNCVDF